MAGPLSAGQFQRGPATQQTKFLLIAVVLLSLLGWNALSTYQFRQDILQQLQQLQVSQQSCPHGQVRADPASSSTNTALLLPEVSFSKQLGPVQDTPSTLPDVAHQRSVVSYFKKGSGSTSKASSSTGSTACLSNSTAKPWEVCLDLVNLLGIDSYLAGILWQPLFCSRPLKEAHPGLTDADKSAIRQKALQALTEAAAKIRGVKAEDIDINILYWANVKGKPPQDPRQIIFDPAFTKWHLQLMRIFSQYVSKEDLPGPSQPLASCRETPPAPLKPSDFPLKLCNVTDEELLKYMGRLQVPQVPISRLADLVVDGFCPTRALGGKLSFGDFIRQRMLNPEWKSFKDAKSLDEDTLLYLMDIMYERNQVFLKQKWAGVTAMQVRQSAR